MPQWTRVFLWTGPLLLLLLTAIAGYAYSQIRYLSLPIPQALALFTVVLPIITGISTQGVSGLIQRSSKSEQYQLTIPLLAVLGFQLMYETIIATLALTKIIPPSALSCDLNSKWQSLFQTKNIRAISAIQDSLQCCGFNSVKDRSFPFGQPSTCAKDYGRSQSCAGKWRRAEQVNAGLLLLVAVVVFMLKLGSVLTLLTSASWTHSRSRPSFKRIGDSSGDNEEEEHNSSTARLLESGDVAEPYRDDPEATGAASNGNEDHSPAVLPSALGEARNEWADDEQSGRNS
ncbi:hypothetical protein LSUE1_G007220 [Lachnellula suecica]|uniref:Tetraspanin n=1 Tax=Lachnellula suecica TaxID=602035 RepID=A0A8T9CAY7_9HELO|nr:hypothetical protein LSUE1_G007220 [Lachnellula suecica]